MDRVYVSIGSNSDAENNFRRGIELLREQVKVIAVSPVYETLAVGGNSDDVPYLNAVIVLETDLDPVTLKENILIEVEEMLGRVRGQKAVPLDLDILLFNKEVYDFGKRQIPDTGIEKYAYIALPLADVAPEIVHPVTGVKLAEIAARFQDDSGVTLRPDLIY